MVVPREDGDRSTFVGFADLPDRSDNICRLVFRPSEDLDPGPVPLDFVDGVVHPSGSQRALPFERPLEVAVDERYDRGLLRRFSVSWTFASGARPKISFIRSKLLDLALCFSWKP